MPNPNDLSPEALQATIGFPRNFARVQRIDGERVEVDYDLDLARWPWLALPALHPVMVDKVQYFSAVTASLASGSMKAGTHSALTKVSWSLEASPEGETRHAARGVCDPWVGDRHVGYEIETFDEGGHRLARIRCEGVVFADGDFEALRDAARAAAKSSVASQHPAPADPVAAGLGPGGVCFLSPAVTRSADGTEPLVFPALVRLENGFHPRHPFHTGSGDHVNAGQLMDCAFQAAHLAEPCGAAPLQCVGGEALFRRFVELDVPFEIEVDSREVGADGRIRLNFRFRQRGTENARITLDVEPRTA